MSLEAMVQVKRWDVWEASISVSGVSTDSFYEQGFDVEITAPNGNITIVKSFYAGNMLWKARFMPDMMGTHYYVTKSDIPKMNNLRGVFACIQNDLNSHGHVHVEGTHFYYADQTPAFICGTTLYAWWYRPEEICLKTLESLKTYGFNKVRMLVFPKYLAGFTDFELTYEPPCLPFERKNGKFNFQNIIHEYFDLLEKRIKQLNDIGVEAEILLFHNYDFGMWGIDEQLSDDSAIDYLQYMINRFSAFKNVWWSLANEYDIWKDPDGTNCIYKIDRRDWSRLGMFLMNHDPHNRLRTIHNIAALYPNEPWLTHVSVQFPNTYSLLLDLKNIYDKPIINDEYQYEGNLRDEWGNVSGEEETIRHWLSVMAGAYATHGECFVMNGNKKDIFWTYGGTIVGESASRIAFLKQVVEKMPYNNMFPDHRLMDGRGSYCIREHSDCYFHLFLPECQKRSRMIHLGLSDGTKRAYRITVYDLWDMKVLREFEYTTGGSDPAQENETVNPMVITENGLIGTVAVLL